VIDKILFVANVFFATTNKILFVANVFFATMNLLIGFFTPSILCLIVGALNVWVAYTLLKGIKSENPS
jgi:hypothetical protein